MRTLAFLGALLFVGASAGQAPESFNVTFKTDVPGDFVIQVTRSWAPLGADHFYELVQKGFFKTPAAFFRVVPDFVVQFGISGTPAENEKWKASIKDDPVVESNLEGTITYADAGPNTRGTQLFVNYANNTNLNSMGFAPFGKVISGLDVLKKVHNPTPGQSGGADQGSYESKGQAWIKKEYPTINSIIGVTVESQKPASQQANVTVENQIPAQLV